MNKQEIILNIIEHLSSELAATQLAADNAHSAATDDQSVAETQYDTLAIEASYLAEGQSMRVEEIKYSITQFEHLQARELDYSATIKVGSLVQLNKGESNNEWFFIAPSAGGFKCNLQADNVTVQITVITPHSPMGKALLSKEVDDDVSINFQNLDLQRIKLKESDDGDYIVAVK